MIPDEQRPVDIGHNIVSEKKSSSGSADCLVCFFGTYERNRVTRIEVLLQGLRAHGYGVYECNEPLGIPHEVKVSLLKKPWRAFTLILHICRAWAKLWRKSKNLQKPSFVLVPYMGHFDVILAKLRFPDLPILLDHMIFAEDTAHDRRASKIIAYALRYLDRMALRLADVIILDTLEHEELVPPGLRSRSVVVPIGAPELWLSSDQSHILKADGDSLHIIFFGLFTPLQGIETIARSFLILKERGLQFSVMMVGRGQDYLKAKQLLGELEEIAWTDWLEEAELLACVRMHHVCLGIFGSNAKSQRVVPQKLFLGASAGCVVVTSDTPPQRRMFQDHAYYVQPGDAKGLAETLASLARNPKQLSKHRLATQAFAKESFHPAEVTMNLHERLQRFYVHS